jgi:2-oxoglutarate ferredoxin oxidoreductase subunit alpha
VREALSTLAEQEVVCDFMRVRGFPFGQAVEQFLAEHDVVYVVEQNRDAQLRSLLTLETAVEKRRLQSIRSYGGYPLSARTVVDAVLHDLRG